MGVGKALAALGGGQVTPCPPVRLPAPRDGGLTEFVNSSINHTS